MWVDLGRLDTATLYVVGKLKSGHIYSKASNHQGTLVPDLVDDNTPRLVADSPQRLSRRRAAGGWDPQVRIKDMDHEGIDAAVLYHGFWLPASSGTNDVKLAAALCRAYNNWLADYCKPYPERLDGMAILPLQDIDAAIGEMQRVVPVY